MDRNRLPNRRPHELQEFDFRGQHYTLGVGRDSSGEPVEIFIDASKEANQLGADARDAAVALSIALQYGVPAQAIREAVTRLHDGSAAGIVGAALDLISEVHA
jgi:hypothetical protein